MGKVKYLPILNFPNTIPTTTLSRIYRNTVKYLNKPADLQIHALHAISMGLCFKVNRGDIDLNPATEIFGNMRLALIKAKEWKMEKQLEDSPEI